MQREKIVSLLDGYDETNVNRFASYCIRLKLSTKRDGSLKNPWFQKKTEEHVVELFKRVDKDGLVLDGDHVTIQKTGVSYDYVAYKNKMLQVYPESKIDIQLVYKDDEFRFSKNSGIVTYSHDFINPFGHKDEDIVGGYAIIKNDRGEFITLMGRDEFEKHRKVAKTDDIWKSWYPEMCKKTVVKKGCSDHFEDLYSGILEMDNGSIDLERPAKELQVLKDKLSGLLGLIQDPDLKNPIIDKITDAESKGKNTPEFYKEQIDFLEK